MPLAPFAISTEGAFQSLAIRRRKPPGSISRPPAKLGTGLYPDYNPGHDNSAVATLWGLAFTYEQERSLSRRLTWPRDRCNRVDFLVLVARPAFLLALLWGACRLGAFAASLGFLLALYLLVDVLLVVTTHAFHPKPPLKDQFRFVVLNVAVFLTLVPFFAVFLSVADRGLTWSSALATSWAAITASAVIKGIDQTGVGTVILVAATATSVYFVIVILVIAVGRAMVPHSETQS